jgi:hypothetical protein
VRTLVNFVSVAAALVWSAIVWGGYGLIVLTTDLLARSTVQFGSPYDMENLAGLIDGLLRDYGTMAAAALWALGLLGIIILRALINWLISAAAPRDTASAAPVRDIPRAPTPIAPAPRPVPAQPEVLRQPAPPAPPPAAPVPERWGRNAGR